MIRDPFVGVPDGPGPLPLERRDGEPVAFSLPLSVRVEALSQAVLVQQAGVLDPFLQPWILQLAPLLVDPQQRLSPHAAFNATDLVPVLDVVFFVWVFSLEERKALHRIRFHTAYGQVILGDSGMSLLSLSNPSFSRRYSRASSTSTLCTVLMLKQAP